MTPIFPFPRKLHLTVRGGSGEMAVCLCSNRVTEGVHVNLIINNLTIIIWLIKNIIILGHQQTVASHPQISSNTCTFLRKTVSSQINRQSPDNLQNIPNRPRLVRWEDGFYIAWKANKIFPLNGFLTDFKRGETPSRFTPALTISNGTGLGLI